DAHPASYPPTVISVTDGTSTDGSPVQAADVLRRLHTDDGECLVYNLHVRSGGGREVIFPDSDAGLDEQGRLLFGMSSPIPPHLLERASQAGFAVRRGARFFAYGAGAELVAKFFELGTRPTRLA
ncbi:MAG: VWA domain-containing protein, partial [Spirochaetota bacterium]